MIKISSGASRVAYTKEEKREYNKAYHEANRAKELARMKAWQQANPEKLSDAKKVWCQANPEKVAAQAKRTRLKHKEEIAARKSEYHRTHPEKQAARTKVHYEANVEKIKEQKKAWHQANRGKIKLQLIAKKYGLSPKEYADLRESQDDRCAICRTPFSLKKPYVDHCHRTGKTRGLLCRHCNLTLGAINDDIRIAQGMVRYLKKHTSL